MIAPVAAAAEEVPAERARLVATLRQVGPDAPTLAGAWSARELASHLAAQDRLRGVPAYLARTAAALTGLRLSVAYRNRPRIGMVVNGPVKRWERSLDILSRPSPRPVLAGGVAVITLWELFVHHEDVRRPNSIARTALPDLEPVLEWILRYNHRQLTRRLRLELDGSIREAGHGDPLTVVGSLADVLLWLSGRPTTKVQVDAPAGEADEFRRRLAI